MCPWGVMHACALWSPPEPFEGKQQLGEAVGLGHGEGGGVKGTPGGTGVEGQGGGVIEGEAAGWHRVVYVLRSPNQACWLSWSLEATEGGCNFSGQGRTLAQGGVSVAIPQPSLLSIAVVGGQ